MQVFMTDIAILKFNGGMGAVLCSKCWATIREGSEMTEEDNVAMKGEGVLEAQYCEICNPRSMNNSKTEI